MKLRIVVLMTEAFASPGGVQLVNRNMAAALSAQPGWESDFFSLKDGQGDPRYLGRQLFWGASGQRPAFVSNVSRAFVTRDYDVLMITHRNLFPLATPWTALTNRPYLLFAHGIEIWDRQPALYRMPLLGATAILANSRYTRDRMCAANGVPPERVCITPLCPDFLAESMPAPETERSGDPRLFTVARAMNQEQYKGQDIVIRALPRILKDYPRTRYVIAGGGSDDPRLRALARETGVEDQVDFRGRISDQEREHLFRSATIFVMPSRGEGFGLAYLEAMRYRLPCIAGNTDGSREVVREGINGYAVDPTSPQAVGEAVLRLLDSPSLRESLGQAGYRMVESEYSFECFSASLQTAFKQLHTKSGV